MTESARDDAVNSGSGPKSLDAAMLRIRDMRREPVGLAFLVTDELALTCAHVVSAACGKPEGVEPPASAQLSVDLPLVPVPSGRGRIGETGASVERWIPAGPSGSGDVAVLRLSAPLPGALPIRLIETQDVWEHPARVFGFPAGRPGGVWHSGVLRARQGDGWVQVDLAARGYRVSGGFSGSPVWDDELVGVVGMMAVAEAGEPPVSYLVPTAGLTDAWPELRTLALPPSPFRSLTPFREADAPFFYGREAESDKMTELLSHERWVTVVGPSGSGKSSVARAGVAPRMRADGAAVVALRPASGGKNPLSGLAASLLPLLEPELCETDRLARVPRLARLLAEPSGLAAVTSRILERHTAGELLVVVDQFEELLALDLDPAAVEELAEVLYGERLPSTVRVLTTLRADFLEAILAHPHLGPALSRQVFALGPMSHAQLREVITRPVDATPGVHYEPRLADRILNDVRSEPGALPLLVFTLDLLWQAQTSSALTHRAYDDVGGVAGALSEHLRKLWPKYVNGADEPTARQLFTQLIRVPLGSVAATRRTVLRGELSADEWRIAQRLAATRLLVTAHNPDGVETVELAHEALITSWDKLREWAEQDRAFLVFRESLRHDMDRWESADRAAELLPTYAMLEAAEPWERSDGYLGETEHDYLQRGRARLRSIARRRRAFFTGTGLVLALALIFGSVFAYVWSVSQERQRLANSRALTQASQDEAASDPVLSVKLALAAYQTSPTQAARNQLLRQYVAYAGTDRLLSGMLGDIAQVDMSRDGDVVLATSELGRATLFVYGVDGRVRSQRVTTKQVVAVMVSSDGERAGFVDDDGAASWFEVRADAERPIGPLHRLPDVSGVTVNADASRRGAAMSPDGGTMVVTTEKDIVWWDLDRGAVAGRVPKPEDMHGWIRVAGDNKTLLVRTFAMADDDFYNTSGLVAVDTATGVARTLLSDIAGLLLSGDGKTIVVCERRGGDGDNVVLSRMTVADGALQGRRYSLDVAGCDLQAIDGTGGRVVMRMGGALGLISLNRREVLSRTPRTRALSHLSVRTDYFPHLVSDDGKLFVVSHDDVRIAYVELRAGETFDVAEQILADDGRRIVSITNGGSALVVGTTAPGHSELLAKGKRSGKGWDKEMRFNLALNQDETLLADWDLENGVTIREFSTLRKIERITVPERPRVGDFAHFFGKAGHLITVSGTVVQQWNPRTGEQLARFDVKTYLSESGTRGGNGATAVDEEPFVMVLPHPTENRVAVLIQEQSLVRVVDLVTGRVTASVKVPEDTIAVQFERSRRYLAVLRSGGIIEVWRLNPLRRELGPLRSVSESTGTPYSATFIDSEGGFLVAANNSIRIYQVGERSYRDSYDLRSFGTDIPASYYFIDVSADGKTVIYQDNAGRGGPLHLDPTVWKRELCDIIGQRNFISRERVGLPVDPPEQPLCPRQ